MENNNHDNLLLQKLIQTCFKTNRKEVNYSQEELNTLSGINSQTISKIENGRAVPLLQTFFHLVIVLEIDANELIAEYKRNSEFFNRD